MNWREKKMVLNPRHFEKHYIENNAEIWGFHGSLPLALLVPQQWQEWGAWPRAQGPRGRGCGEGAAWSSEVFFYLRVKLSQFYFPFVPQSLAISTFSLSFQ